MARHGVTFPIQRGRSKRRRPEPLGAWGRAVLKNSPLAWYRFNETTGTVMRDWSGNGHNGTYTGAPGLAGAVMLGDSDIGMTFDGSTQYGLSGDTLGNLGSSALTASAEVVISTTDKSSVQNVFGSLNASNGGLQMYVNREGFAGSLSAGRIEFLFVGTGTQLRADVVTPTVDPFDGNPHHIVCVVTSSTTMVVYIDTAAQALTYYSTGLATPTNLGQGMVLGGSRFGGFAPSTFFHGNIYEAAFYTTQLSSTDVGNHYAAALLATLYTDAQSGIIGLTGSTAQELMQYLDSGSGVITLSGLLTELFGVLPDETLPTNVSFRDSVTLVDFLDRFASADLDSPVDTVQLGDFLKDVSLHNG